MAKPKKRNPQQEWMDIVQACSSSAPLHLRENIIFMSSLDNIPRKEKQFVNFASNSLQLRGSNNSIVHEIWCHLRQERERRMAEKELKEKEKKALSDNLISNTMAEENRNPTSFDDSNASAGSIDPKKVKEITKRILKEAPNRSMRMKKLRNILKKEMDLPKGAKKQLKALLFKSAKTSRDSIKIDGKIISLK